MKYSDLKTKKDKIAYLKEKLGNDPKWAIRGMLRVYAEQTASEKAMGGTVDDNGVGFSGVDGNILSSFSDQIDHGRNMSEKQMRIILKKMPKYARQLMELSETKS